MAFPPSVASGSATPLPQTTPTGNVLQPQDIPLDPGQKATLLRWLEREISACITAHSKRQKFLADLLRAYKALPEFETKNFPWPDASNVVIPIVAICVDTIASRLQRAVLGAADPVEVQLNTKTPFMMTVPPDPLAGTAGGPTPLTEKDVRDWAAWFLRTAGGRDRLRTVFFDMPLYGDAFVSPLWVEEKRVYHAYGPAGEVVEQETPGYVGVRWHIHPPTDVYWPTGFDEWDQLPYFPLRLRYSEVELVDLVTQGAFQQEDVDALIRARAGKQREDERRKVERKTERVDDMSGEIYELYEIRGRVKIPASVTASGGSIPADYQEVVLTYSLDHNILMRAIYNPYFGKARHFVKIPYLAQAHELPGMGVAEMALPFQKEATTSHNQVIDAATSANAGIVVVSNEVNVQPNTEIYPGRTLYTDGRAGDGLAVVHLGEPNPILGQVEEKAAFVTEKRTGVSVYNLGMESPTVGSRATATGTTALINEGNMRFWVSIDDMRSAIQELFYLTIQQEQQMRPEGFAFESGRYIQFPPGDPRTTIALNLKMSSESVNRDIEVQQMQILMQVVNDYYMRLNQAMMMIANPQFPPQAKMMAVQVMQASSVIVKKFVERFNIEDVDAVVPTVMQALQSMAGQLNTISANNGQGAMAAPPVGGPGGAPPSVGGGPPQSGSIPPVGRVQ